MRVNFFFFSFFCALSFHFSLAACWWYAEVNILEFLVEACATVMHTHCHCSGVTSDIYSRCASFFPAGISSIQTLTHTHLHTHT